MRSRNSGEVSLEAATIPTYPSAEPSRYPAVSSRHRFASTIVTSRKPAATGAAGIDASPLTSLHSGGPDALFTGSASNVVEGLFEALATAHRGLEIGEQAKPPGLRESIVRPRNVRRLECRMVVSPAFSNTRPVGSHSDCCSVSASSSRVPVRATP